MSAWNLGEYRTTIADYKRAAELDAKFTLDYDRALARLMPAGSDRDATPAGHSAPREAAGLVATLMHRGGQVLSSTWGFAAFCAALVGFVAVAGFAFSRRG